MSEPIFQLTRTSQSPVDLRLIITASSQTFSLAPNETTIVGPEVKAAIDADASLQKHFTCTPFAPVETRAVMPAKARVERESSET